MTEYRNQLEDREYDALMSAAPDLLAACEAECCPDDLEYAAMVLELSDPGGTLPGQLRRKAALERAAIAKARGGGG